MPTQRVIAEKHIYPKNIKTAGFTRITWQPVWIEAGREYAIVILTDDANAALKIAEPGKYDEDKKTWVSAQPYQIGVLLSSSNASTWTPHQSKDLCFKLLAAKFTETQRLIDLGNFDVKNISDVIAIVPYDLSKIHKKSSGILKDIRPQLSKVNKKTGILKGLRPTSVESVKINA